MRVPNPIINKYLLKGIGTKESYLCNAFLQDFHLYNNSFHRFQQMVFGIKNGLFLVKKHPPFHANRNRQIRGVLRREPKEELLGMDCQSGLQIPIGSRVGPDVCRAETQDSSPVSLADHCSHGRSLH